MRIGPPAPHAPARLLAAKALVALTARSGASELDALMARRVRALREEIERGTYRVDPGRIAASMFEAIGTGGL